MLRLGSVTLTSIGLFMILFHEAHGTSFFFTSSFPGRGRPAGLRGGEYNSSLGEAQIGLSSAGHDCVEYIHRSGLREWWSGFSVLSQGHDPLSGEIALQLNTGSNGKVTVALGPLCPEVKCDRPARALWWEAHPKHGLVGPFGQYEDRLYYVVQYDPSQLNETSGNETTQSYNETAELVELRYLSGCEALLPMKNRTFNFVQCSKATGILAINYRLSGQDGYFTATNGMTAVQTAAGHNFFMQLAFVSHTGTISSFRLLSMSDRGQYAHLYDTQINHSSSNQYLTSKDFISYTRETTGTVGDNGLYNYRNLLMTKKNRHRNTKRSARIHELGKLAMPMHSLLTAEDERVNEKTQVGHELRSRYSVTLRGVGGFGKVTYLTNWLCWSVLTRVLCGYWDGYTVTQVNELVNLAEVQAAGLCTGSNPTEVIFTSILLTQSIGNTSLYFACHQLGHKTLEAGHVIRTQDGTKELNEFTSDGYGIKADDMFFAEKMSRTCFDSPTPSSPNWGSSGRTETTPCSLIILYIFISLLSVIV